MVQWQTVLQGLKFFCLLGVLGTLASCKASGGSEQCAGFEDVISCVQIVSISPRDSSSTTDDVDAFQNPDCDGDPATDDPEIFTKHDALVTFSNDLLPTADGGFDILLTRYSISYDVADCPRGVFCPQLTSPPEQSSSVLIPARTDASGTFDFVPLSVKQQYVDAGGDPGAFPTYRANYVFRGSTVPFRADVTLRGSTEFIIGNFNLCGE